MWVCAGCGGRAMPVAVLKHTAQREQVSRIWNAVHDDSAVTVSATGARGCPFCGRAMRVAYADDDPTGMQLDVCKLCQILWFDPGEDLAPVTTSGSAKELSLEARRVIAEAELRRIEAGERADAWKADAPEGRWQWLMVILGFPVELDHAGLNRRPWVTWVLAAGMVLATLVAWNSERAIERFGLVVADPFRYGGATLLTSFFLHNSTLHVVGSLYFLLVVGASVEDDLGRGRYLMLLIGAVLGGGLLHATLADPLLPLVGADAGLSGLIACFVVWRPHAKVGWFFHRLLACPAYALFLLWVADQILLVTTQHLEGVVVSGWDSLGGAAIGAIAGLVLRRSARTIAAKPVWP